MDPASCILYVLFLMLSSYFAATETAYAAVSKVRMRTLADKGNKRAARVLWITDRFDRTLTTILIGNNIFHAACASLSALLVMQQFSQEYVIYGTLLTTFIVYLFAEMIPKSFAKARAEELALFLSGSMMLLVRLLTPVSAVFSVISMLLSKLLAGKEEKTVTEEELLSIIETIEDEGVLEPEKQALVNSAIEFRDKLARDIMIPMEQIVCIDAATPIDQLAKMLQSESHSRLPVFERSRDNIVGILPVNLFLSQYVTGKRVPLRKILLKPYIFDSEIEISVLLQRMRLNKLHMVFLVDKNRRKVGIITMEDLLEELVGDIQDESDAGEGVELQ
ncbi:MAG: HlyC/CorC family transporter [Clostridia bacterium]|nr:HlyC/CorC family transporter [Clostridia bacterium]